MELAPVTMVSLEARQYCLNLKCLCFKLKGMEMKAKCKFISVNEEAGLVGVIAKTRRQSVWYLYELEMESLIVVTKRVVSVYQNQKVRSGRSIKQLFSNGREWCVSLEEGLIVDCGFGF